MQLGTIWASYYRTTMLSSLRMITVVDVKIDDVEAYGKYKEKVKPLIESYGGEYLSRGGEINVLENELWEPHQDGIGKIP